jgi:hypothetical protein
MIPKATTNPARDLPRGVYRTSWGNRFVAEVTKDGQRFYLGTYADADDASTARAEAVAQLSEG